jgi:GTP cyclohydrolase I
MDKEKILNGIHLLLEGLGEDTRRAGLLDTPRRVLDMAETFFKMASIDERESLGTTFSAGHYDDFVIVKNIRFSSFCEHHLLPFFGKISVAYVPANETVIGLSKIVRVIDKYSKRLQLQERLTDQITATLSKNMPNRGIFILVDAHHMCMGTRGVLQPDCTTITRAMTGEFQQNQTLATQAQQMILARAFPNDNQ